MMFWTLGFIWGSSFIYMKLASVLISPLQIVLLRLIFGLVPVAIFALYNRSLKLSHGRHFAHLFVLSMIGTVAYYYGFVKGASILESGVVGALSGLTPIFSYFLALLLIAEEKPTVYKVAGIIFGFMGVLAIARPFGVENFSASTTGVLYTLLGSLSVGASFVYVKKYILPLGIASEAVITYQLGIGVFVLLIFGDLNGLSNIWQNGYVALGVVFGLGILGTGVAYILYYYIIETLGAVAASSVAYVPPLVALIIGVVLVGEKIVLWEYIGAALILVGVCLINRRKV